MDIAALYALSGGLTGFVIGRLRRRSANPKPPPPVPTWEAQVRPRKRNMYSPQNDREIVEVWIERKGSDPVYIDGIKLGREDAETQLTAIKLRAEERASTMNAMDAT